MDISAIQWKELGPASPFYFFIPSDITTDLKQEYERGWKITEIFKQNSVGIVTARDKLVIDFDKSSLLNKIALFRNLNYSDEQIRQIFFPKKREGKYPPGDTSSWKLSQARRRVYEDPHWQEHIYPILYRPFDIRWIYYTPWMVERGRWDLMVHMLRGENVGLAIGRQWETVGSPYFDIVYVSKHITDFNLFRRGGNVLFPLYLYVPKQNDDFMKSKEHIQFPIKPNLEEYERIPNFTDEFKNFIIETYGDKVSPEDILHYIYAILYHPEYRKRYEEFLKYDFPRVPFPESLDELLKLADIGKELVKLHLLEFELENPPARFMGRGDGIIRKIKFDGERIHINEIQYFEPVSEEEWNYYIGGYRVLEKWLKERKGRKIDSKQFMKVIHAIRETIKIQDKLNSIPLP